MIADWFKNGTFYDGTAALNIYVTNSPLLGTVTFKQSTTTRLTTTKSYDYLNRLRAISSVASGETLPLSYAYAYNNANQRFRMKLNDGSYWVYEYDALGQVKSGKRYWPNGTPVAGQQFEYGHDTIGNRTATAAGGDESGAGLRPASYSANSKNQYTSRGVPAYIEVQGIAKVDATVTVEGTNGGVYRRGEYFRKELNVSNASAAQYPTIDVDTDVTSPVSGEKFLPLHPESFGHDPDGNLTNDGRWTFTWDAENRLVKQERDVASPSGARQKLEFEYDWQGRRIRKQFFTHNGSSWVEQSDTLYLYDGWNLIAELNANSSNAKVRTYIWGLDLSGTMQGAGGVGGLLMVIDHTGTTKRHYAAYDGNGNVMGLVDSTTGKWSARYEYGPFGEPIRANGDLAYANPIRWSTKYTENESGLVYYGYRSYNPSTGRWLNRDPLGEPGFELLRGKKASVLAGGPNGYLFVQNSPISHWDYLGLDNPGCDIPFFDSSPNGSRLHDCLLRCCAQHDHCFFTRNGRSPNGDRPCRASSWSMVWNPCSPCGGCNRQAIGCFAACLFGGGPDDGDRWFCPNGPNRGRFYDVWEEIPADCWETGERP